MQAKAFFVATFRENDIIAVFENPGDEGVSLSNIILEFG
jgi:hypothetical protein